MSDSQPGRKERGGEIFAQQDQPHWRHRKRVRRVCQRDRAPLGSFAVIMDAYGAFIAVLAAYLLWSGRRIPERCAWSDLGFLPLASGQGGGHRSAAGPFTGCSGTSCEAEVADGSRGHGLREAVGELVSFPFYLDQWPKTARTFRMIAAPRPTPGIAGMFIPLADAGVSQFASAGPQDG